MKSLRFLGSLLFAAALTAIALAADVTGTWKWTTTSPNGGIDTTLKLEMKDGKLTGAYSNQFGDTTITNATLKDDTLTFEVVRDLGGNKFVIKYSGKLDGDTIKGSLETPGVNGSEARKLDWNAKREKAAAAGAKK